MLDHNYDRRQVIKLGACALALAALPISKSGSAQALEANQPYTLAPLPYPYDGLEPVIGQETMRIHHDKHHQAYITNLNKALQNQPKYSSWKLEKLVSNPKELPQEIQTAVRNQGGGHLNHTMFWESMAPIAKAKNTKPSAKLGQAIEKEFGSFDHFRQAFESAGAAIFGSGWVWLAKNSIDNSLRVITTANQDSPLALANTIPVLGNDVWEHAYYLNYQNRRADYLKAWWQVVDWGVVSKRFEA